MEHRAKIGVRARAILGQFWRESDVPDAEQAMEIEAWMDVLENCSHTEIREAWRDYMLGSENRNARGRLLRPDPGALRAIIQRKRPRPQVVADPEPEREVMTNERRKEVCEEMGVRLNKWGGVTSL